MLRPMRVIGLMSGTSADAVDAALVAWPDGPSARPFELLAAREDPFPVELRQRIHGLAAGRVPGPTAMSELLRLDAELGERFAESARRVARDAGVALDTVDAVASHGQTIAHHPELRGTLQLGDPSVIAERTGCTTVADFRARDLAAGGEGAPLAPFFHHAVLADPAETRVVLNLGGIANVTWLPAGARAEDVLAFDCGPANALIDGVVGGLSGGTEPFDRDGARARRGRIAEDLLMRLLDDDFLRRKPPKSTGRERYGAAQAEALLAEWRASGRAPDDLVATLVEFTAQCVARACRDHLPASPAVDRLLVGGGGASNPTLLDRLRAALPDVPVEPFEVAGIPAATAEAMAFSLLGRNALLGLCNHLPQCTGARRATVLGEIARGASGRPFD